MRHRKAGVKLNRTSSHREAMFRNMVTSLLKHDRIHTTDVKAKELRRWADHVITLAKRGDLHARRQAMAIVREKEIVHKLFEEAGKRFGSLNGGYTRIVKIGRRPGDAAPISLIELVASEEGGKKGKKKTKSAAKKKADTTKPATAVTPQVEPAPEKAAAPPDQAESDNNQTTQEAAGGGEVSEQAEQESASQDLEAKAADAADAPKEEPQQPPDTQAEQEEEKP